MNYKIMDSLRDFKDKFDWDRYLESKELEAAPNFAFQHVDNSQQSLLEVGMMVEVQTSQRPRFWLANVTLKCGPFLRLKHVGREDSNEIWTDPSSVEIHPVGYSSSRGWPMEPPSDLKPLRSGAIASLLEEHKAADCEASLLSPAQQMKTGMTLEVEDSRQPRTVWPATVVRNVGGRLLLKYILPKNTPLVNGGEGDEQHEWLFCLSPRLHWQGWAASQSPTWIFNPPVKIRSLFKDDNLSTMATGFCSVAGKPWQFRQEVPAHCCNVSDRIEALDPSNPINLRPATVVEVVDPQRLLVRFDAQADGQEEDARSQLICFSETAFRPEMISDSGSQTNDEESESGFSKGMALEVSNPWKPKELCVGVVTSIERSGKLVRIRLEKESDSSDVHPLEFLAPVSSQEIFPIGWCDDNGWPLVAPSIIPPSSTEHASQTNCEGNLTEADEKCLESTGTTEPNAEPVESTTTGSSGISYWCPKIYFNFRCFTGPLLSRIRVAALPRSVGPGPISLMMKEVLTLLLNGAYKPGSVLKQLQGEPNDPLPPGTQLEPLKAKYRQTTYRGTVPMASTATDVPEYCRWVCGKLQCCPYLFAPELVGDPCPHRCCILAKSVWQHKKKAPNWRHRRFVDIIKSLPMGLDPVAASELQQQQHNSNSNKSGPASLAAIESADHSDDEEDDDAPGDQSHHPTQQHQPNCDSEEPAAKKRRGRPRKIPVPMMNLNHASLDEDRRQRQAAHDAAQCAADDKIPTRLPAFRLLELAQPALDRWRAGDVWFFLQSTDCRPLADRLLQYEVDGPSLLLLQPSDIMDYVTLNWELALRLCYLIGCLRLTYSAAPSSCSSTKTIATAVDTGASNDLAKSPAPPPTARRAS